MRKRLSYSSYEQFKTDLSESRLTPWSVAVEDIADEMFHKQSDDDFKSMWDTVDSDSD